MVGGGSKKEVLSIIVFNDKITFKNSNLTFFRMIWSSIFWLWLTLGYKLPVGNDLGTISQMWKKIVFFYPPWIDFHWNLERSWHTLDKKTTSVHVRHFLHTHTGTSAMIAIYDDKDQLIFVEVYKSKPYGPSNKTSIATMQNISFLVINLTL